MGDYWDRCMDWEHTGKEKEEKVAGETRDRERWGVEWGGGRGEGNG